MTTDIRKLIAAGVLVGSLAFGGATLASAQDAPDDTTPSTEAPADDSTTTQVPDDSATDDESPNEDREGCDHAEDGTTGNEGDSGTPPDSSGS
jgi:hypothetical protein